MKNKLDIKVYHNNIYEIDDIYYCLNSIKHNNFYTNYEKFRIINYRLFGIELLRIEKFR